MNKILTYIKYVKDFGLAFISSLVVTVVTSFIVNPILAEHLEISVYGNLLTLCGYVSIISSAIGNSLNNVRLLDKNKNSDGMKNYNAILLSFSLIGVLLVGALSRLYIKTDVLTTTFLCLYVFLSSLNLYWIVCFRIQINYVRDLVYNCIVCMGYLAGLGIFAVTDFWPVVYVLGQACGLLYLMIFTKLPHESLKVDEKLKSVFKSFICLCGTTFIAQALSFLDRVVLHPLVGDVAVSQYNTASFFGKGVGLLFGPIALVLLSYFVKDGFVITKKIFWVISGLGVLSVIILLAFSVPVAPFITKLLYPSIYAEAKDYIFIANIGAMLNALGVLLNPLVLRVCSIKYQPIIQLCHGGLYFSLGVMGTLIWGIWGFGAACIVANLFKVILLLFLGGKYAEG